MKPVSTTAALPNAGRANNVPALNAFDQDLTKAIFNMYLDIARRLNAVLPMDGTEPMTGDLNMNGNDIDNILSLIIERAGVPAQYLQIGPDTSSGHFIKGFSAPDNAKVINYEATTDVANTVPTVGLVGHIFSTRGTAKFTISETALTATVGQTFGSTTASAAEDTSRHVALWGTFYGFSVTGSRLNYVAATTARHAFIDSAGVEHFAINLNTDNVDLLMGRIAFPATQNPSTGVNVLDDYEEGDWTPAITFVTPGDLSIAYSRQVGRYIKVGKMVTIWFSVITSTFTHTTASGELRITGLPFTHATVAGMETAGTIEAQGITFSAGRTALTSNIRTGNAFLNVLGYGSAVARDYQDAAQTTSGTQITLLGSITYEAAT